MIPPATPPRPSSPWLVVKSGQDRRWGGEIRRQEIFGVLADRTGARVLHGWSEVWTSIVGSRVRRIRRVVGLPAGDADLRLAASEQIPPRLLRALPHRIEPVTVAVYDHGILQAEALGVTLTRDRRRRIEDTLRANQDRFRWLLVPTRSFADYAGLDPRRIIVGGNGTVTDIVRPGPWPDGPAVGMAAGAAPGRGIETLIEAMRLVRERIPDARLYLWLVATGPSGTAYLAELQGLVARESWITVRTAPYQRLGEELAHATVVTVPTPASMYSDVALPVKLFDYAAAGRPVVVTPRVEAADLVRRHDLGLVAGGDDPASLAAAYIELLEDPERARRIADAVLGRAGG